MSGVQRASKPGEKTKQAKPPADSANAKVQPMPAPAPAWLGPAPAAPFSLAGVQRKVAVGPTNDAYEQEADNVASSVAGGGRVAPGSISSISSGTNSVGQRAAQPDDTNKKDKKASEPSAQREVRPEDRAKDPKASLPLQRQPGIETATNNKDKQKTPSPVQRAEKPADNRREKAAPGIQRAEKPKEKKDESSAVTGAKNTSAQPKPELPAQRAVRPEDTKKIELDSSAPLQTKNKDENSKEKTSAPVQKESKKDGKEKDAAKSSALQRDHKPDKKADDKAGGVQRESKPDAKQSQEKKPQPPMQRSERPEDKKNYDAPSVQKMDGGDGNDKIQASAAGPAPAATVPAAPSMESVASQAIASKGAGEPLNAGTRSTLESGLGSDLSDVRVHDDSTAHSAADALNARAFTHQNDIWLGRGESQTDTRLMAHEATHVVQQTGSLQRQVVQRATTAKASAPPASDDQKSPDIIPIPGGGQIDWPNKQMLLPKLEIPGFKTEFLKSNNMLTLPKNVNRPEGEESQAVKWRNAVGPDTEKAAQSKLMEVPGITVSKGPGDSVVPHEETSKDPKKGVRFLRIMGAIKEGNFLVGTPDELKSQFTIPRWGPKGMPSSFDVDHKLELQLGGENDLDNLWLLNGYANRSSGSRISNAIRKTIKEGIKPISNRPPFDKADKDKEAPGLVRSMFTITYSEVVGGANPEHSDDRWIKEDILKVKPFEELAPVPEAQARKLLGNKGMLAIYPLGTGGQKKDLQWNVNKPSKSLSAGEINGLGLIGVLPGATFTYQEGSAGTLTGTFRPKRAKDATKDQPLNLTFNEVGGIPYTLTIQKNSLLMSMQYMEAKALSPIQIKEVDLEEGRGIVARGKLAPSIPLFKKLDIDITIDSNDVTLSKTFTKNDFNFPGPIKVPEASLTLSIGTGGLAAEGVVLIEIERLGKGRISAGVSTKGGLELAGSFDFDTQLFDPANVHVEYKDGKFSGGGKIGIKPGKVRGIKTATIEASFADGAIDAKGSIQPDIPAVEQADLSMHYDEKSGLTIAGDLQLKKDIPGIADGSIHAEVNKKDDKYVVKAHGEATPKIPGISSKLIVNYDDGAFDATITAGYEKGMLKGTVSVGVTNRPVGDDGKPGEVPAAKADKLVVYGGGSVTLQLAPWLQATAAIRFLPNGEVEVTGKIGLPSVLNLFDEKKVQKNIFNIHLDIPILGFSVLGHNVGIFLEIGGGLDLNAGIGPGQLQDVELSVTYNPAHEENTEVHGHAALHIPAHAGLRLFVSAALGAGIPLVDAKAGLELGGTLGIEGALHAAVDVDWSPKKGLVLDANAEVYAEPKFKFDITGFVLVEVDLLFTTKTLYEKRWQLAAVEYGSGLRLGMKLPVHYEEGKPFSVSLSDIQFEVPQIDPMATIKGLFDKIV
jgi:hypothetical protein